MVGLGVLCDDLIVEILVKLPVKSLLRLSCVCKKWASLISDPYFIKYHYDSVATPTYRFLVVKYSEHNNKGLLRGIISSSCSSSSSSSSSWSSTQYDIKAWIHEIDIEATSSFPHDHKFKSGNKVVDDIFFPYHQNVNYHKHLYFHVVCCCRGLILIQYYQNYYASPDLTIWNPSTGDHVSMITYNSSSNYSLHGFVYDPIMDDYLIIAKPFKCEYYPENKPPPYEIFSLKCNSWTPLLQLEGSSVDINSINIWMFGGDALFFNKAHHGFEQESHYYFRAIVALDLEKNNTCSSSIIPLPNHLKSYNNSKLLLMVLNECLAVCYTGDEVHQEAEIWIMKEYKVQSSWTKSFVLSTSHIPYNCFYPTWFTKSGAIIGSNGYKDLVKFNEKGDMIELKHYSSISHLDFYHEFSPCHILYRESLARCKQIKNHHN